MKFGNHLANNSKSEWSDKYLDYKGLKDLIKLSAAQHAEGTGNVAYSPRTATLTVQRPGRKADTYEEQFFQKLEQEVEKVGSFTSLCVSKFRSELKALQVKVDQSGSLSEEQQDALLKEAQAIAAQFLALEKYVNLNYMGFHKILKKHDKCIPAAPCRQFYVAHLHNQPWVQGTYSDVLVYLSLVYSKIRGDASGTKNEDAAQGFVRSTTKYWVTSEFVSTIKYHVLQHLPVFQFDKNNFSGDAQLVNSVYFDNDSLELYHGRLDKRPGAIALRIRWYGSGEPKIVFVERKTHRESWKGEESVKERFTLKEENVVPFLEGKYTLEKAVSDLKEKGKSEREIEAFSSLFTEIAQAIDSKQLRPFVRTQYMRTAFQIPFDATVRISLDTNLVMIKENPEGLPTLADSGRWYRDPALPIARTEITRFPHAVLEVKLSLPDGETAPAWVQEMIESGYLTEVHKMSKFIHGTCTLFPDMVQAVPYWVDDESVRASMLLSAAAPAIAPPPPVAQNGDGEAVSGKPRKRVPTTVEDLTHPLLGDQPTLRLLPEKSEIRGFLPTGSRPGQPGFLERIFGPGTSKPAPRRTAQKLEPKTFFANERTYLSWLHMAITIGSIAAALLGFAGSSDTSEGAALSRHLVEIISIILLPLAILMSGYAIFVFWWRGLLITKKRSGHFDDRYGPLGLCGAVTLALSAIFVICLVDFVEAYNASKAKP